MWDTWLSVLKDQFEVCLIIIYSTVKNKYPYCGIKKHSILLMHTVLTELSLCVCHEGLQSTRLTMKRAWAVFKAHPYISNVLGYTTLFATADLVQQSLFGKNRSERRLSEGRGDIDLRQTARVATVGFCFHANFNYHWLRWLERMLPGSGFRVVAGKVVVDQLIAAPLTISAFYIGECI